MALITETLPGAPGGMNLARPAQELDDTEARYIQDGLVDLPGLVRSRGPVSAAAGVARAANKGSGLLVCADPRGTGKFAVLHGTAATGFVGLLSEDRSVMVDVAWPHALPAAPPANPHRIVDSKPGAQGGAWIGVSNTYEALSVQQALAFWFGGDKATYSTGTVAFSGGGVTVNGTGTTWVGNVVPGMFLFARVENTAVAPSPNYFGAGVLTLIGVVKSVNSNTSITLVSPSPYSSSGTLWTEATPAAKAYEFRSLRGFAPRVAKGLITCSTTSKTVTGGNTKWVQQGIPTVAEASRTTKYWNLYRLSDGNWVGRVDKANSDTSLELIANAAVSLVDEPYIMLRGDSNWDIAITTADQKVGWLNAVYSERQFFANVGQDVAGTSRVWFSDPADQEAVDLATYNGDFIDIPSTVSVVEPIRGLLPTYNSLLVFKETETYAIYGNTPTSFSVRKLEDDGLFHPMAVQPFSGGAIWPGRNGIYLYDGINVRNATADKLGQWWKELVRSIDFNVYRCWSMMSRNHYFLHLEAVTPSITPRKGNIAQPVQNMTIVMNMTTQAITLHTGVGLRGTAILPQASAREAWYLVNGADTTRAQTTQGLTASATAQNMASDTLYAVHTTATQTGYAKQVAWKLDGQGTGTGIAQYRFALYADNAGEPGALLAQTDTGTIADGAAAATITATLTKAIPIVSGTKYWIVLHLGTNGNNVRGYRDLVAAGTRKIADTYADGMPTTWNTAGDTSEDDRYAAWLLMDFDRAVVCDAEELFDREGLDTVIADRGAPLTGAPGPDIYMETKKFDVGDGLRLKRFKQFGVWYLAQGGGIKMDAVTGLNEIGTTLATVLPASVYNWDQLGTLFTSWDALAAEMSTWDDIVQAVFLPKRTRFSKKSQYFSMRLYRETDQVSRAQFGPFMLGFKTLRSGRVT